LKILSGESERGEGVEEKGRKKIRRRDYFASDAAAQLRWLAGTGQLAGEGSGDGEHNSREKAEPLSLEREKREKEVEK